MSSSLGYSFIDDKNENKKPVVKPKRNITIKKKKNFLNGIQKILSRSDDSDDLDDFKPLNKKEDVEEVEEEGDDTEVSMQSFKKITDENNSVKNYMENFTAMGGQPINDNTIVDSQNQQQSTDITDGYLNTYVPQYTKLNNSKDLSGSEDSLMKKLNYMIHLLEEQQDQKTENVTEELVLYSFLGIFVIFVVDGFARAGKYTR
tara:strand:- start:1257 stop:1865 length:609 start_codon:yes stop_codon:yes gene_type:complete